MLTLQKQHVEILVQRAEAIGLTEFEVESLRTLEWFRTLCKAANSPEHYPDVFHLWTAERNGLDGFLTLDKKLQNLVERVRNEKRERIEIHPVVLRPLDLLRLLGVDNPDPIPVDVNRFYHLHEL